MAEVLTHEQATERIAAAVLAYAARLQSRGVPQVTITEGVVRAALAVAIADIGAVALVRTLRQAADQIEFSQAEDDTLDNDGQISASSARH